MLRRPAISGVGHHLDAPHSAKRVVRDVDVLGGRERLVEVPVGREISQICRPFGDETPMDAPLQQVAEYESPELLPVRTVAVAAPREHPRLLLPGGRELHAVLVQHEHPLVRPEAGHDGQVRRDEQQQGEEQAHGAELDVQLAVPSEQKVSVHVGLQRLVDVRSPAVAQRVLALEVRDRGERVQSVVRVPHRYRRRVQGPVLLPRLQEFERHENPSWQLEPAPLVNRIHLKPHGDAGFGLCPLDHLLGAYVDLADLGAAQRFQLLDDHADGVVQARLPDHKA
mmetsp:Transcript_57011/g.161885  ORF Transcript_57011/g.161885 Transcript_57011/m.161885 type:complete len:282 (+) Transcript_57011:391-1236(+)